MASGPVRAGSAERTTKSFVRPGIRALGALTVTAYAVLGSILLWSRAVGLTANFCCDELATVERFVRGGPGEILAGPYVPNNHELFSLLAWASSALVGESEMVLRLGSVIPFVVGVAAFTSWLHVRLGALSGVLFLFLATFSPLLLDLSRQARGYGLAFLAMSVMLIAALEAEHSRRLTLAVVAFCSGGLLGTLTLPHFGIAFIATGCVLMGERQLRRRTAIGLAVSALVVGAWYSPHVDDIVRSSGQPYGTPIETSWILTAPIDQTLVPALSLNDDSFFEPSVASLVIVIVLAAILASSPLVRERRPALVTCAGTVMTVVAFWASGTEVVPRFFSFLLVPLLGLIASGSAAIVTRRPSRFALVRASLVIGTLSYVTVTCLPLMASIAEVPRDRLGDVADVVSERAPSAPVVAYVPYPLDLVFHLGRPVEWARTPAEAMRVCKAKSETVLVSQPWLLPPVKPPCMSRPGVRHVQFKQYGRGGQTDVWIIPPPVEK
jgi:hypothetical protein